MRIRAEESEEMARLAAVKPGDHVSLALRDWATAAKNMIVVMLSVATVDNTTRLQRLTADFTALDNRAEAAGGTLFVISPPGKGTLVTATLPLTD